MKISNALIKLGADYRVRVIDRERVVYRDFGTFDVEISGLDTRRGGCVVYVWDKNPVLQISEIHEVDSLDALKAKLIDIEKRKS